MPRRTSLALLLLLVVGPAAAAPPFADGDFSQACAATLQGFLDELRVCVAGAG